MTLTTTSSHVFDRLISAWEQQQDAYVNRRAERFRIILDALAFARPELTTVLDLAGGLGSFSRLILDRFPSAQVITLDYDPAMLALARHNLDEFGDRSIIVEADLSADDWPAALAGQTPDAVVSSTALHWLTVKDLVGLYGQLATLLPSGGLFFNADHLSHASNGTFFTEVSGLDDRRQQQAAFATGVPDWDGWWDQMRAAESLTELVEERDRRFAGLVETLDTTATLHQEALRVGGFAEVGTLWQYFDDYVIYGVR